MSLFIFSKASDYHRYISGMFYDQQQLNPLTFKGIGKEEDKDEEEENMVRGDG